MSEILSKPKLVIFEGCDKVGKSTLYRAYRKATKFGPLAIDRFTGSNWVYDVFYNRATDLESLIEAERVLNDTFDCYLVLVKAQKSIVLSRILSEETGVTQTIALDNFERVMELFEEYLDKTNYSKILRLDTSVDDLYTNLGRVLYFTGEPGIRRPIDE